MYELFTLRKETSGQDGHWQETKTSPYGNDISHKIEEQNSESLTEPTSIPSPFARLELARTAFRIAADCEWENVPKRYQKIVSDCLDVAEIFFNHNLYKDYIEIIKWNKSNLDSDYLSESELGKTMKKFIFSDKDTYHFDRMDSIYLLNYIGENRPDRVGLNIIGATSPITVFFSIDNDLSYVSKYINFTNGDKPFDKDFNPLEKRDINFIKYLANLSNQTYSFSVDFKEFYEYIIAACNKVQNFDNRGVVNYNVINVGNTGDFVNTIGYQIHCQGEKEPSNSDFEIKSSYSLNGRIPLILPVSHANSYEKCAYIDNNDLWGKNIAPEVEKENNLNNRILPGTNIKYPYLTVSDFFEDTIVKMPFDLNRECFFDSNRNDTLENSVSYLLPLKPTFFDYFSTDDLKHMISMEVNGPVVKFTLKIPIRNYSGKSQNSFVIYSKTYQTNRNERSNIGNTTESIFGLGLYPIVRPKDVNVAHYRVGLFNKCDNIKLSFYNQQELVNCDSVKERRKFDKENDICGINIYALNKKRFDRIDVDLGNRVHGFIIPIFKDKEGNKQFNFAVDFGTTNTHISYSINNVLSTSAFNCTEPQVVRLHNSFGTHYDINAGFRQNFVPSSIDEKLHHYNWSLNFPIRSAFAECNSIDYEKSTYSLSDGNIPFTYPQEISNHLNIKIGDDLKWSTNQQRVRLFIRNIAFVLHNKVLLEDGDLRKTKIRWFYPASMSDYIRENMENTWNEAYRDYFDSDYNQDSAKVSSMSESIAPYCYYINKGGAMGVVTTIDIGGGSTDVYVSNGNTNRNNGEDGLIFSFRFASNSIFGDGYNNGISNNGFVSKYKKIFEALFEKENNSYIESMNGIFNTGNSAELISFFFSLASYEPNCPGFDFMNKLVNDQKFKYVFLIFYSAVLYHIAQSMKAKNIDMPQTVVFTGNGSRTLQVISQNPNTQANFVRSIFETVYNQKYTVNNNFTLKFDNNKPKEATANGGLEATDMQINLKPDKPVFLGSDNTSIVSNETYNELSPDIKKQVIENVNAFIDFVFGLNVNNLFGNSYNIDVQILDKVKNICRENLDNYLEQGINKICDFLKEDKTKSLEIRETLFFFPIVGMLNNLASKIYYDIENNE